MKPSQQYELDKRVSQLESDVRQLREMVERLLKQQDEKRGPGRPRKDTNGNP